MNHHSRINTYKDEYKLGQWK